jgi:hypothetical protein
MSIKSKINKKKFEGGGNIDEYITLNNGFSLGIDNKGDPTLFIQIVETKHNDDIDKLWLRASRYVATAFQKYDRSINARKHKFPRESPLERVSDKEAKTILHDIYQIPQNILDNNDYNRVKSILYRYLGSIQDMNPIPKQFLEKITDEDATKQSAEAEARQRAEAEARQREAVAEEKIINKMIQAINVFKTISDNEDIEAERLAKEKTAEAERLAKEKAISDKAQEEQLAKGELIQVANTNLNQYQKLIESISKIITKSQDELQTIKTTKAEAEKSLNDTITNYSAIINNLKNLSEETQNSILKEATKKAAEGAAAISLQAYRNLIEQIKNITFETQNTLLNQADLQQNAEKEDALKAAQQAAEAGLATYKTLIDKMNLVTELSKKALTDKSDQNTAEDAAKTAADASLKVYTDTINKLSTISAQSQIILSKQATEKAAQTTLEAYKNTILTTQKISVLLQDKLKQNQEQLYDAAKDAAQKAAISSIQSYAKFTISS